MKQTSIVAIGLFTVLLSACSIGGMAGPFPGGSGGSGTPSNGSQSQFKVPPAAPQVVYRIDENRFFEIVPYDDSRCDGFLRYTDKDRGIQSRVSTADFSIDGDFIIDAANTNYLIGPLVLANGNCGADTADMPSCSDRMPYSTDSGKTWKYGTPRWIGSGPIVLIEDRVFYAEATAKLSDFPNGYGAWKETNQAFPKPRKAPIDTKFHCNRDEED